MRMKNRKTWVLVSIAMLMVLLAGSISCGAPASTPSTPTAAPKAVSPTTTAAPPTQNAVKPTVLRFSTFDPPTYFRVSNTWNPWMQDVEKKSGGRIKFDFYPGEQLGKSVDHYDMAIKGIADIAWFNQDYSPGRFPLTSSITLPFLGFKTGVAGSQALWKYYALDLAKEYADVHVLTMGTTSPHHLNTSKKAVRKMEDLKGMKIRVVGGAAGKSMELLGATPVTIAIAEVYTSMERGLVDGFITAHSGLVGYKLQEVMKYTTVISMTRSPMGLAMNKDTYNKLPADLKKILDDSGDWLATSNGQGYDKEDVKAQAIFAQKGIEIINLPPEEMKRWQDKVAPIWDDWVNQMEGKGLPGKKVMADLKQIIAEQK